MPLAAPVLCAVTSHSHQTAGPMCFEIELQLCVFSQSERDSTHVCCTCCLMLRTERWLCNKLESNGLKPEMREAFFCPSFCPVKYGYSGEQERGKVQIYGVVLKNSSPNTTAVCDRVKFK